MIDKTNKKCSFPTWLSKQLDKTGLSNRQLAKKLGVQYNLIGKWLRGDVKKPQYENLVNLAQVFGNGEDDKELIDLLVNLVKNSNHHNKEVSVNNSGFYSVIVGIEQIEEVFDRVDELKSLSAYRKKSQLILITGVSGIGKSFLASYFYNSQSQEKLLYRCYSNTSVQDIAEYLGLSLEYDLSGDPFVFVMRKLKRDRCLLVLDNLDLDNKEYGESYRQLLEQIATLPHQSCVIVTCRSLPRGYSSWQPNPEIIRLEGLRGTEANRFLDSLGIPTQSDPESLKRLIQKYGGNPWGLKLAAQDILNFRGGLAAYLKHSTYFASDLHDEIQKVIQYLSNLELEILYWLALLKEPIYFDDILREFPDRYKISSRSTDIGKAIKELYRRSLLQTDNREYCLQPEVQTFIELNVLNAIHSELEGIISDIDTHQLHWLRCLDLEDERIRLCDRLFRRDPELIDRAFAKVELVFQNFSDQVIGYAKSNLKYLSKNLSQP